MKNIYSLVIVLSVLFSVQLMGQSRIYPPNLRSPENGATGQDPLVVLDWDAVTGQTTDITYEAQIATLPDFSDAITFDRTELTAVEFANAEFNKKYYWRVKAYDADEPSGWSEVWSFRIISAVNVKSPKLGKEVYANPEIKWDPITGLTKYEMQVDTVYDWNVGNTETTDDILGAFLLDDNHAWIVGEGGLIKFYDGVSWSDQDGGTTENLNSAFFISADNGYAVGDNGTVIHFDGTAWSPVDAGTTNDLNFIYFPDPDNGWAVGSSGSVLNYSSGTWTESTPGSKELFGVFALSTTNVWACGAGKIVMHFDGTGWTSEEVGTKDHYAIWFTDANNGWVVGKSGKISYFNGTEWSDQKSGVNKDLYAVSFNGSNGFAVGKSGTILQYLGAWQQNASLSEDNLNAVSLNGSAGIIAGNGGYAMTRTEGFDSPYAHFVNVPPDSSTFLLEDLPFGADIYYRMRAMHPADTTEWSATRMMTTYATVELKDPDNNLTGTDLTQLFKWTEYDGASQYFFEIAQNEDFEESFSFASDSNSINFNTFYFNAEWWWRVRAAHKFDFSDWSEVWTFTTTNTVALESPEDNAENVTFCPLYKWQEIKGVTGYQIWIDTTTEFQDATKETVKTPYFQCKSPLEREKRYYWKVRAISTLDSSDFSPTWSFMTEGYTGIEDHFGDNSIEIYPNPNNGIFTLRVYSPAGETYGISVLDLAGRQVYSEQMATKPGDNQIKLHITGIRQGMYMLHIKQGNNEVSKKLFIK
ncbi:MAG: T9SS type A sorting domain-containing protein [Chlorobi bacterium]|nr:T9SS type A sorting domain-containing protein [Chlorobiota bacterium]